MFLTISGCNNLIYASANNPIIYEEHINFENYSIFLNSVLYIKISNIMNVPIGEIYFNLINESMITPDMNVICFINDSSGTKLYYRVNRQPICINHSYLPYMKSNTTFTTAVSGHSHSFCFTSSCSWDMERVVLATYTGVDVTLGMVTLRVPALKTQSKDLRPVEHGHQCWYFLGASDEFLEICAFRHDYNVPDELIGRGCDYYAIIPMSSDWTWGGGVDLCYDGDYRIILYGNNPS